MKNNAIPCGGYASKQEHMRETGKCPVCFKDNLYYNTSSSMLHCRSCKNKSQNEKNHTKGRIKLFNKQLYMQEHSKCYDCGSINIKLQVDKGGYKNNVCFDCVALKIKEGIEALSDNYVLTLLKQELQILTKRKILREEIPLELIAVKRASVDFKRELKQWREVENA